jgi:single-stranded DNA-binding protein
VAAITPTTIVGTLEREPEIRYSRDGIAHTRLAVSVEYAWQDPATLDHLTRVSTFEVVADGDLAENIALSLPRGSEVICAGALESVSWEDGNDGSPRELVQLHAHAVGASLHHATADVMPTQRRSSVES